MDAPGRPGILPTWTSSAKDLVGTALGQSRLWFTLGYGIVNEVYYPRVDLPQVRDLGFIVGDGEGFWREVKRVNDYTLRTPEPGVPAAEIVHRHDRYELTLRIVAYPERDVLMIDVALDGDLTLLPYALLAPHLGGSGRDNTARVITERGHTVLAAQQGPLGLAFCAADPEQNDAWMRASAGYVGFSDGWQDFNRNGGMTWRYPSAGPGNVALMGQLPRPCTVALAFGGSEASAATLGISALIQDFREVWDAYAGGWRAWLPPAETDAAVVPEEFRAAFRTSAMVLKTHQDKTYNGAMVASLSIPWGNSSDDIGGYHLVWPRDLAESALALLTLGLYDRRADAHAGAPRAIEDARDILRYLVATQLADGRWPQNQWLGGTPHWTGVQLDEVAWPVFRRSTGGARRA
jgi:glucoamylase